MLEFIFFSAKENCMSFLCCPRMFYLYLSISCVSSWGVSSAGSVLVSNMPMVMLSLLWTLDGAPVAYLTPPSWCTAEGAVLVDPGGDPIRYDLVVGCHFTVNAAVRTTSQSLSGSNTWPLRLTWNPSARLPIFFELWGHPPSDAALTPAISLITE